MDKQGKVTLLVQFPVVRFKTIEVEVTPEKASDLCDHHHERSEFIEEQVFKQCPDEHDWLAMTIGQALDNDFATIKRK